MWDLSFVTTDIDQKTKEIWAAIHGVEDTSKSELNWYLGQFPGSGSKSSPVESECYNKLDIVCNGMESIEMCVSIVGAIYHCIVV